MPAPRQHHRVGARLTDSEAFPHSKTPTLATIAVCNSSYDLWSGVQNAPHCHTDTMPSGAWNCQWMRGIPN